MEPCFELKEQWGRPACLQMFGWPFCMVNIAQSLWDCLLKKKKKNTYIGSEQWVMVLSYNMKTSFHCKKKKQGTGSHRAHFLTFTRTYTVLTWQTYIRRNLCQQFMARFRSLKTGCLLLRHCHCRLPGQLLEKVATSSSWQRSQLDWLTLWGSLFPLTVQRLWKKWAPNVEALVKCLLIGAASV